MIFLVLILGICLSDLMLKKYVEANFEEDEEHHLFHDRLHVKKVHNHGFAFGALKDDPDLVRHTAFGITVILVIKFLRTLRHAGGNLAKTGLAMVIGGGLSNWFDRFHQGYVTDYLNLNKLRGLKKIYFNLADFFVILGGLLLILSGRRKDSSR